VQIIQTPSPNFSKSKYTKIGVEIHKTLGLMPGTLEWLRNPRSFVSYHFLLLRAGGIRQLVQLKDRSWSAGRINRPSERAKKIMIKYPWGTYIKPGHYLAQVAYECLSHQTFTDEQYKDTIWLFKRFSFKIEDGNFLHHQDTAVDKPNLEMERMNILARLETAPEVDREKIKQEIIFLVNKL